MPDLPAHRQAAQAPLLAGCRPALVGLLLVLLATTVGAKVIASADDRVPAGMLPEWPSSQATSSDNLTRVDIQLGDGMERYLSARGVPADTLRPARGPRRELVPASAVAGKDVVNVQPSPSRSTRCPLGPGGRLGRRHVRQRGQVGTTQTKYADPRRCSQRLGVLAPCCW